MNELKQIVDKLYGFNDYDFYEVCGAERQMLNEEETGYWILKVRHVVKPLVSDKTETEGGKDEDNE